MKYLFEVFKDNEATNNHKILILRIFCNLFIHNKDFMIKDYIRESILENFSIILDSDNKNIRASFASLLFNFTILMHVSLENEPVLQIISILNEILLEEKDASILQNTLLSIGNMLCNNPNTVNIAKDLGLLDSLEGLNNLNETPHNLNKQLLNTMNGFKIDWCKI